MRASTEKLVLAIVLLLAACSTRKPGAPGHAGTRPPIEVRGEKGELVMTLTPRAPGAGWDLLLPDGVKAEVTATASGAVAKDASGTALAELGPGPAGFKIVTPAETFRANVPAPPRHLVHVLTVEGITVMAYDYRDDIKRAVARDQTTRQVATATREPDRILVEGKERLGTVHNLPDGPDAEVAAVVLTQPALPLAVRAVICAHLLGRPTH